MNLCGIWLVGYKTNPHSLMMKISLINYAIVWYFYLNVNAELYSEFYCCMQLLYSFIFCDFKIGKVNLTPLLFSSRLLHSAESYINAKVHFDKDESTLFCIIPFALLYNFNSVLFANCLHKVFNQCKHKDVVFLTMK